MAAKYKEQVQDMLDAHKDLFTTFKTVHDEYAADPKTWQTKYNEEGQKVMHVIKRWENNLCSKSEGGKYGKFSSNLADKFWEEVRKVFPKIDYVGMQLPS